MYVQQRNVADIELKCLKYFALIIGLLFFLMFKLEKGMSIAVSWIKHVLLSLSRKEYDSLKKSEPLVS